MPNLRVRQALSQSAQAIRDDTGTSSPIHVSTTSVGIARASPEATLDVGGDIKLEYNGSPRLTLHSRGNGTQRYSIRATNNNDRRGGRALVIRNESAGRDDIVLDGSGNLTLEHNGSPQIALYSRGNGTQRYSLRATNSNDDAGGRRFVIRNETQGSDVLTIDSRGNITVGGDITVTGGDCAEQFSVADSDAEPGTVMVIGTDGVLLQSTTPYDRRVAGVISGAHGCKAGLILSGRGTGGVRRPLALTGTVFCKVDATLSPVQVGDLLASSSSPGHAMKAADRERAFGAVIGKALRGLPRGVGLIPILVSLQ